MGQRNGHVNGTNPSAVFNKSKLKSRKSPDIPTDSEDDYSSPAQMEMRTSKKKQPNSRSFQKGKKRPERKEDMPCKEFVGTMYQADAREKQDGIFCPKWVMQITSTRAELLVLAQLLYWFGLTGEGKLRARIKKEGYHWVAKTYRKLGEETHLTPAQVRVAIRSLRKARVIVRGRLVEQGEIPRYRLNPVAIQKKAEQAMKMNLTVAEEDEDE